jgi:hypothetical protein
MDKMITLLGEEARASRDPITTTRKENQILGIQFARYIVRGIK